MRTTFKLLGCLVLVMCLVLGINTSALAYNETYLAHPSGYLAPGETISGAVYPTYGRYMGIIVSSGLLNAADGVTGALEFTMPPVYKTIYATNQGKSEMIWNGYLSKEYVVGGNTWFLTNNSNYTMAYTLAIIERWD